VAHEFQNGEHTEEWPAADRPTSTDGADNDEQVGTDAGIQAGELTMEEPTADEQNADQPTTGDPNADDFLLAEADSPRGLYDDPVPTAYGAAFAADDSDAPVSLDDDSDEDADAAAAAENGETIDLHNAGVRDIDATTVSITQGGARDVDATTVTINQGGAARIRADELNISQGGVGLARTERLTLREGGTAFAVFADKANLDPESSVFLLVAGSTTGDVRPVLDWRAAAAFGAAFAFVLALLRRGRR
jgi:hypothetical protein